MLNRELTWVVTINSTPVAKNGKYEKTIDKNKHLWYNGKVDLSIDAP